mgnify:FL=1
MYITDKIKKKISNSSKCVHHLPNDKVQHLFISCFESYAIIVFNVIVLDKIRKNHHIFVILRFRYGCINKILTRWRTGASIPVPLACKASALPSELVPLAHKLQCGFNIYRL